MSLTIFVVTLLDTSDREAKDIMSLEPVFLEPTIFFCFLLPPIIFNAGYTLKARHFVGFIKPILAFAIFGTLIATIVFGIFFWLFTLIPSLGVTFTFAEALCFGALLGATDPVSTLAVFSQLKVEPKMFYIVFGESVFNDAMAIVLFQTFSQFAKASASDSFSWGLAFLNFFYISIVSVIIGLVCSGLSSYLFKKCFWLQTEPVVEICLLIMFAYLPFVLAESIGLSGIVSVLFAGIGMKHYTHRNLSNYSREASIFVFNVLAQIMESTIFLVLGLSIFALPGTTHTDGCSTLHYNFGLILVTIILCLLARAAHIYPLGLFLNYQLEKKNRSGGSLGTGSGGLSGERSLSTEERVDMMATPVLEAEEGIVKHITNKKLEWNEMHMLNVAGLRGAVAFALSLEFAGPRQHMVMMTTMAVVVASVLLGGGITVPALNYFKIRRGFEDHEKHKNIAMTPLSSSKKESTKKSKHTPASRQIPEATGNPKPMGWFTRFDNDYIMPILTHNGRRGGGVGSFSSQDSESRGLSSERMLHETQTNLEHDMENIELDVSQEDDHGNAGSVSNPITNLSVSASVYES
eukprot:g3264.t1